MSRLRAIPAEPPAPPQAPNSAEAATAFGTWGDLNLIGVWTLYQKEVRRFFKVIGQTVVAPIMTTLVFLAIFALALGQQDHVIAGLDFTQFIAPGLVMMAVVQNAFANTSSSLMIAKIQGNIVDYLMPPLSAGELLFGLVMGGITRGLIVGGAVWLVMLPFVVPPTPQPWLVLFHVVAASMLMSCLGILAGLWAEKFDQLAMVTNFVVTPLSFLSGTFYSIAALPASLHLVALVNPFFYMIDGARYGATGHADGDVVVGMLVMIAANLALWRLALHLLRVGYRLKA